MNESNFFELDKQRREIAGILHDDIGGDVVLLLIMARSLDGSLPEAEINECRDIIIDHAERIERKLRAMMEDLYPASMRLLGLNAALTDLVSTWRRSLRSVDILLSIRGTLDALDEQQQICCYRIIQEALNNIGKYSSATRISIEVYLVNAALDDATDASSTLQIDIVDNGVGFDVYNYKPGRGLREIDARVQQLGGCMRLQSSQHKGTTLSVEVPV